MSDLEKRIRGVEREEMKDLTKVMLFGIVPLMVVIFGLMSTEVGVVGYITHVQESSYTDDLYLVFNSTSDYSWVVGNVGELKSVRLSGSISSGGNARVYLDTDGVSYLIYDSSSADEGLGGITGLVISNITLTNDTVPIINGTGTNDQIIDVSETNVSDKTIEPILIEPINNTEDGGPIAEKIIDSTLRYQDNSVYDEDNDGTETLIGAIDFRVDSLFNWDVSYDKLCTKYEVYSVENVESTIVCYGDLECCSLIDLVPERGDWNETFYLNYGKYGVLNDNIVSGQVIYANYSLEVEGAYSEVVSSSVSQLDAEFIEGEVEFSDVCVDSCLLFGLNDSSYGLRVEVGSGILNIDSISYSVVEEVVVPNVTLNITLDETLTKKGRVEIGKPVKWSKRVKLSDISNVTVKVHEGAENIVVSEIENGFKKKIKGARVKRKGKGVGFGVMESGEGLDEGDDLTEVVIDKFIEEVEIEYETPGPEATEEGRGDYKKKIVVSSDTHYIDILAYTSLTKEVGVGAIKLYWITDGLRERVDFDAYDTNRNGLVDYVEWIVPTLSNQTYELEIAILNVQSYPTLGGEWTVMFETTGIGDLVIEASNGTTWSNVDEQNDLKYLETRCGDDSLDYGWISGSVVIEDYNCSTIGYHTVKVLTSGKHTQRFNFSGIVDYANNMVVVANNMTFLTNGTTTISFEINATMTNTTNMSVGNVTLRTGKVNPMPVGYYNDSHDDNSLDNIQDIFVVGDYAYTTSLSDDRFVILNISNKTGPTPVGEYTDNDPPYSIDGTQQVYVVGDYAYVTSFTDDAFTIINITNKSGPVAVGSYNDSAVPYSFDQAYAVHVVGDYAYVTSRNDDSFNIVNITNKSGPVPVGEYNNSAPPYSMDYSEAIFVQGDYAYVTSLVDDSLTILNITNKSGPVPVGEYVDSDLPYSLDGTRGIFVLGNYSYVTSYTDDSLTILNITNKSGPKPVGDYSDSEPPYSLDGAWDVFVEGDFAYVTSYDDDSLTVLNVSDKSNPFPVGSYGNYSALPYSLEQANAVHVLDGYAYVSSSVDDSINVIDIDTYLPAGIYTSQIFDLGFIGIWQNISWVNVSEPRTNVTFQVRSCNDVDCEGETLVGPDNTNSSYFNNNLQGNLSGVGNITDNQYVQYRAFFVTNNSLFTSVLENVTIFYIADSLKPTISLLNPGDGLNTTNTSINFNWTAVDNSDLNLSCNLTINSLVNVSGIESANNTPTNMTVGGFGDGTYRWNVTCLDNSSNSNTSSTNIFTVDTTAPFVGLISPSNISWVNTRNVTFNFTLDELLPDVCWLYVNASDTWTSVVNNTDPVNGKNNLTYNLSDGAYIWNVWCNDSMGFSAFNESNLTFFVDTIFPNITNENRTPTAVYTNSTLRLNVTVVDDRGLDTIWVEGNWSGSLVNYTNLSEIGSGFNITVNLSYLLNQKLVGWRVYANDSAGNLNTSPLRTFFVNNLGLPPTPNLTSPVNNSVVVFDSATFEWVRPTDPDNDNLTYDILVSRNVTFTDIEANITLINNTESYNINGAYNLTKGTRYWKVRAKDLVNYSNYSDYWQITVVEAVINLTSPANNTIFYPGNATNITIKEERGNEWVNNVIVQIDGTNYTAVNDTDSSNDIDWYYLYTLPSTSPKVINITSIGYNNTVNETVTHDLQLVLSKLNSSLPTVDYVCSNATYAINNTQSKISFKTALDTIAKKTNVSIVTPSGDIFELNLSSTNKLNLTYTYDYFYKLDEVGNYTLKANITDVEGNSTVYNYTFVSYANTTGTDTINLTSIGTTSTKLLDVCGENVLYNGTFVLNRTILAGSKYDVKFETADPIIIFNSVGLNGTYALALNYTNIAKSITAPSGKRVVIEFELKSNFTTQDNITIIYNYSSIVSALDDEDGLVMYKCDSQSDCSWSLISSTVDAAENIITGTTGNLSVFLVAETAVTTTTVTADAVGGGGGGGGGVGGRNLTLPVGLDLISNEPFEMVTDDTITIDIVAKNIGKLSLHNIALSAISNSSNVGVSLENSLIERLRGGEENDVTLTLKSLGEEGRYKITVNAEVERPELNASTDIYFDIRKRGYVNRTIILTRIEFAKDLFKENPECLELEEVLRNAEDALAEDNLADAALLMNSAVQSCRDLIAAKEDGVAWLPSPLRGISVNEWIIFVIELLVVIVIMVIAVRYYMRRRALI